MSILHEIWVEFAILPAISRIFQNKKALWARGDEKRSERNEHRYGSGKIMLACQNETYIDDYCAWMAEHAGHLTEKTVVDPERFREELAQARLRGYAMDNGEIEEGLICVGAPIYDMNRRTVAAVSVAGPDYRMREDQDVMIREVRRTAGNISRLLGYRE